VVMVRNISLIQPNLQHTIAASRILTRSVTVKVVDMELIQNRGIARTYYGP
jgi:hypothetical protein